METKPVIIPDRLKAAAREIEGHVRSGDAEILEAAKKLAAVKAQFENGEFERLTWRQWSTEALKLGDRRIRDLLRIGRAAAPQTELADQRADNAARQERHRAALRERGMAERQRQPTLRSSGSASKTGLEPEHPEPCEWSTEASRLIEWARKAPADQIGAVLEFIAQFDASQSTSQTR